MSDICQAPIEALTLKHGNHAPGSGEYCAIEAAVCRYTKGEKHSDKAEDCNGSPGIVRLLIRLNDRWGDARRQKLKQFVDRVPNTRGTAAQENARCFMAADWAVRELLPLLCDSLGADPWAEELRALGAIVDEASAGEGESWARFAREGLAAYAADYAAAEAAAYAAAEAAYAAAEAAAYAAAEADYAAAEAAAYAAAYAADYSSFREKLDASTLALIDRLIRVTEVAP